MATSRKGMSLSDTFLRLREFILLCYSSKVSSQREGVYGINTFLDLNLDDIVESKVLPRLIELGLTHGVNFPEPLGNIKDILIRVLLTKDPHKIQELVDAGVIPLVLQMLKERRGVSTVVLYDLSLHSNATKELLLRHGCLQSIRQVNFDNFDCSAKLLICYSLNHILECLPRNTSHYIDESALILIQFLFCDDFAQTLYVVCVSLYGLLLIVSSGTWDKVVEDFPEISVRLVYLLNHSLGMDPSEKHIVQQSVLLMIIKMFVGKGSLSQPQRQKLFDSGLLSSLTQILQEGPDSYMRFHVCWALRYIVFVSTERIKTMLEKFPELVSMILEMLKEDPESIKEVILYISVVLIRNMNSQQMESVAPYLPFCVSACERLLHSENDHKIEVSCRALFEILRYRRKIINKEATLECLKKLILLMYHAHVQTRQGALLVIWAVIWEDQSYCKDVVYFGLLPQLNRMLEDPNERVRLYACRTLECILLGIPAPQVVGECPELILTLKKWSKQEDEEILESVLYLLKKITSFSCKKHQCRLAVQKNLSRLLEKFKAKRKYIFEAAINRVRTRQ
jgi:hypothetical protein